MWFYNGNLTFSNIGDVIFSLFDFSEILLNKSTCCVSHANSICASFYSWQMKEELLGINISLYLDTIDKLFKL